MYDPKSPWHDKRVRLAANHAINRQAINEAETLGFSTAVGGLSHGRMTLPCRWSRMRMIPRRPKHLLKEAGYANGFDAGEYSCDAVYASVVEGVVNDLGAVGHSRQGAAAGTGGHPRRPAEKKGEKPDPYGQRCPWERGHAY